MKVTKRKLSPTATAGVGAGITLVVALFALKAGEREFDAALDTVRYTFHYFQAWVPEASCAGCSLADIHVGLNRQALAVPTSSHKLLRCSDAYA